MTWLIIIFVGTLICLAVLGSAYPSPPTTSTYKKMNEPIPDLRISEYAPNQIKARIAAHNWELLTPVREADAKRQREREVTRLNQESVKRSVQHQEQLYKRYYDEVTAIKERRMREGNPVTKKNPIDPEELPPYPNEL